ncbi:MAG: DUF2238 domain-containing protein [Acidaminococcaceae bacterium]
MLKTGSLYPKILLGTILIILIWSVINPYDLFTWFLEVLPVLIGIIVLFYIYPRFRFSNFVYTLLWLHAIILIVGGHYTYAEMPLFNWLRDSFDLGRNYYDRVGHFAQGFVPAMVTREVLLRRTPLKHGKWLNFITVSICLALSAAYELFEFATAKLMGATADSFLGSQGDVWDAQWDMTFALIGAIVALVLLSKFHDQALYERGSLD